MKKLILPIVFCIFTFIYVSNAYAQDHEGCWSAQRDKDTVCGKTNTKCLIDCSSGSSNERDSCMRGCNDVSLACYKKNSVEYAACLEAGKKPSTSNPQSSTNFTGAWSSDGKSYTSQQKGNTITILGDERPETPVFEGTITGNTVEGRQYLIADNCPNLDHYVAATGTISDDGTTITVTFTNPKYDLEGCFDIPGTERENTFSYSKSSPEISTDVENEQMPEKSREKPSVGVSSKDFQALARANAQYQKAQADLEAIKKANDPRYEAKKDFPAEYNAAFKGQEKLKSDLEILRADLETVHELFSKTNDLIEIEETIESIKKGEIGEYGKMDLFTDAVNSFNAYHDLRAKGVSAKDATTKATLDNFGTSALTLIPVIKAIDLFATTPDFILETFGVGEDNWSRKYVTGGVIGKFAPSGVVEQTTDLMIEDDWADIGNALAYGWGKVQSAEGIVDTTYEAGKLLAGTIGAVPVAIAQGISDVVGGSIAVGEGIVDFVSSWFTYPN